MILKAKNALPLLRLHGRTVFDEAQQALFFNWTCAGFTVCFRGRVLRARLLALPDAAPVFPGMPPLPPIPPYFGVAADGSENLTNCRVLTEPDEWLTLFEGDEGEHSVRTVKLSEANRGKVGVLALETDGEFLPAPAERDRPRIEIVGDSISCGLGNRSADGGVNVAPDEEDGWMSYGALAARELGCEWSIVAESGIEVSRPEKPFFEKHGMDEIYADTDALFDSYRGAAPEKWDFAAHPSDAVVINLGTNDGNTIRFYPALGLSIDDVPAMEAHFQAKYCAFLRTVRALNGPGPLIVCTLGTMDYYLWDRLCAAVEDYRKESGDRRVVTFKFVGINGMTEGMGAGGHPSLKTHVRMGCELANLLKPWLSGTDGERRQQP